MDSCSALTFCRDELRRRADAGGPDAWRWRTKLNAASLCLALAELRAPCALRPLTDSEREELLRQHPMLREHETIPSAAHTSPDAAWVQQIQDRAVRYALAFKAVR